MLSVAVKKLNKLTNNCWNARQKAVWSLLRLKTDLQCQCQYCHHSCFC